MFVVRGRLEPEVGALLVRALEAAREALYLRAQTAEAARDPDAAGAAETGSAERAAAEPLDGDPPTPGQQRADALALVAETALQHGLDPGIGGERDQASERAQADACGQAGGPEPAGERDEAGEQDQAGERAPASGWDQAAEEEASDRARADERAHASERHRVSERYQVVIHLDAPVLADPARPGQCALDDGVRISAETARRLCDSTRVVVRHAGDGTGAVVRHAEGATQVAWDHAGEGPVLDLGRRTRTIPPALRRALQARDRGCRFPGCGVRHTQGHHLQHWANGGPTRLDNLALLCRRHHRAVHEEGYQVARDADGTLRFQTPSGQPIPEVPAPLPVPREPSRTLIAANEARGLAIGPRTGCPSWLGERLDLGWAIDVLHPAAQRAATAQQAAQHGVARPAAVQRVGRSA